PPGVQSFQNALEMVKTLGTVHLIGLYHGQPLPLDASKIQRKKLIGGYYLAEPLGPLSVRAADLIAAGRFQVDPMITHRFPAAQAPEAFALLDQRRWTSARTRRSPSSWSGRGEPGLPGGGHGRVS